MKSPEVLAAAQQYVTDATFQSEVVKTALEQLLERYRASVAP